MKNNKSILLIALLPFVLTSCNNSPSVVPHGDGDDPVIPSEVVDPNAIYDSLVSGISENELVSNIENAQETFSSIKSSEIANALQENSYESVDKDPTVNRYSMTARGNLYDNSVLSCAYDGLNEDSYSKFGLFDETYGEKVSRYYSLSSDFKFIEVRDSYKKANEATSNTSLNKVENNLTNYSNYFALYDESILFDITGLESNVLLSGKLTNGDVFYRYRTEYTETIDSKTGLAKVDSCFTDYHINNYNLVELINYSFTYLVKDENTNLFTSLYSSTVKFSYSTNGTFDKANLPDVTIE